MCLEWETGEKEGSDAGGEGIGVADADIAPGRGLEPGLRLDVKADRASGRTGELYGWTRAAATREGGRVSSCGRGSRSRLVVVPPTVAAMLMLRADA